jgi:hypothetical protein
MLSRQLRTGANEIPERSPIAAASALRPSMDDAGLMKLLIAFVFRAARGILADRATPNARLQTPAESAFLPCTISA